MERRPKKVKILAVDDTASNLVALQAIFSGTHYTIIEASSGAEALTILESQKDIAVILLDVQMPEMNGFETAVKIKKVQGYQSVPIIFITAIFREDPFVKQGFQAGAIDYFSKPFDPEILKMKVDIYSSFQERTHLLREREARILETEELLKAGRKLSVFLETFSVGVLIADREGKICQTNEEALRILKTLKAEDDDSYGEILGWWKKDGSLIRNPEGPVWKAIHLGQSSHNETVKIRCLDGTTKIIFVSASPLRALDNHVVGAGVVIQDVTEPKKIGEDLEDRIMKLISLGVEFEHSSTLNS